MLNTKPKSEEIILYPSMDRFKNAAIFNNFICTLSKCDTFLLTRIITLIGSIICFWSVLFWLPYPTKSFFPYNMSTGTAIMGFRIVLLLAFLALLFYGISINNATKELKYIKFSNFFQAVFLLSLPFCVYLLFAAPLLEYWRSGKTTYMHIGGFLPWSDALGHYTGAINLLELGRIDDWNMRRPINAVLNAYRLGLTGNLQAFLALGAFFIASAALLMANYIRKFLGLGAALLVIIMLYWNSGMEYIPATMSENNGLIFAPLIFILFCQATAKSSKPLFFFAMFVLAVGLNIRPGAFFIIPAILFWSIFYFDKEKRSLRPLLWGMSGAIAGMLMPKFYQLLWGAGTNVLHSNLAFHLYAMAVGSRDWAQILTDMPELFKTACVNSESQTCYSALLDITLQKIMHDPLPFTKLYFEELFITYKKHLFLAFDRLDSIFTWLFMLGIAWTIVFQRKD